MGLDRLLLLDNTRRVSTLLGVQGIYTRFKHFRGVCCMSKFSSKHRLYLLFLGRALRRSFDAHTVSSESA